MNAGVSWYDVVASAQLERAQVVAVQLDGTIEVSWPGGQVECDLLWTSESSPVHLQADDTVLFLAPGVAGERGVVIGRIGARASNPVTSPVPDSSSLDIPESLVLEAQHELTLRVGGGSITIRDGRILIKGKDLVSHAQRNNRIKGGSVAIN